VRERAGRRGIPAAPAPGAGALSMVEDAGRAPFRGGRAAVPVSGAIMPQKGRSLE